MPRFVDRHFRFLLILHTATVASLLLGGVWVMR